LKTCAAPPSRAAKLTRPRDHHGSRRKRIARGSGTTVQEVNNLLRQCAQMRKMFKSMGSGGGIKAQQRYDEPNAGRQKFGR
jgi:signal recognition particle subunit SRP54